LGDKVNVIYIASGEGGPKRDRFEDIRTDDRKMLTCILKTQDVKARNGSQS
jgi:hypothetical protein